MANTRIIFNPKEKLYLRVCEAQGDANEEVTIVIPKELAGRYLKVELLDEEVTDIPVRAKCQEEMCLKCGVMYCMVHYGNAKLKDTSEPKEEKRPKDRRTIPGHPNCYYGECEDCHVMTCAIHLGFEEEPVIPE